MCGITGLFNRNKSINPASLETSIARLTHRGRDDKGTYRHGHFGMGHTRLSIIDLAGGHQPLTSEDRQLVLIANGEIYNFVELRADLETRGHHFLTHSDSEVILHAYREYGASFLDRIEGMFAFALYDQANQRVILARDRLGIKPLFMAQMGSGVAFSSEIKGLLPLMEFTPDINPEGLVQFLQNQFATQSTTLLRGVERVHPGEAIWIERGQVVRRHRYWSPLNVRTRDVGFEEASSEFDSLMEQVITQHMRSDVPFGLFLSGGVDSAILLAQLSRYSDQPIHTFSVGFPGTSVQDELPLAHMMAKRFNSRHTAIQPDSKTILQTLPLTVWAADELMRDNANMPTSLLARAACRDLKVVFSGEGGDEVFAGYGRYRTSPLEKLFKATLSPGSGGFRTRGTFRGSWPRKLFRPELLDHLSDARQAVIDGWRETPRQWSDLQRMQHIDLTQALPDNLLVKADRMLMAWGVEGRVPFLDHRIVEFGLSLPDHLKIAGKQGKSFLKRWAEQDIPAEHLYGRKRGFYVPVGEWLDDIFLCQLNAILPYHPALTPWFRPEGIEELIEVCKKVRHGETMLWAIIQFILWHCLLQQGFRDRPDWLTNPMSLICDYSYFKD